MPGRAGKAARAASNSAAGAVPGASSSCVARCRAKCCSTDEQQLSLAFVEKDRPAKAYEYTVLVTNVEYDLAAIAQLYRDRGDARMASTS